MLNLYRTSTGALNRSTLTLQEKLAISYHNLFEYPLTMADLIRWLPAEKLISIYGKDIQVASQKGYFYVQGREGLAYKRLLRSRISAKKRLIARKASKLLAIIPGIKMIGLTGSLAMDNSAEDGDIDFIFITKSGQLWATRLVTYLLIKLFRIQTRKPLGKEQKDRLCLNMWLDEGDLTWKKSDRNLYTAHEIAQIVPLINKDKTYEKLIFQNKWIFNYWPNSVRISNLEYGTWNKKSKLNIQHSRFMMVEKACYWIQKKYMKSKMTREVATKTRALFHPQNWGKVVLERLKL